MPVSTSAPSRITAGESVAWTLSLADFPATAYALKYALQAPGQPLITLTATANGSDYAVAIDAAASANYAPGQYVLTAYIERLSDNARTVLGRTLCTILPSPLAILGTSHASRMLALIEAALEGRIPNGLEKTNVDGQELERIPVVDLSKLHENYQRKVLAEQAAALAAAGVGRRKSIGIRFVNPC